MRARRPASKPTIPALLLAVALAGCGYVEPDAVAPVPAALAVAGDGAVAPAKAGSLHGVLRGPVAGLIAENAARVIGGNTGNVIGGNTAGVIAGNTANVIGGNTGNVIGQNTANYGLAAVDAAPSTAVAAPSTAHGLDALSAPVADVPVALYDASGRELAAGVTTDAEGRFAFEDVQTTERVLFVRGRYEQEGHAVELAATVAAPMAGEALAVAVDPATTLVAKKMDALLGARLIDQAALEPAELAELARGLAALLDAPGVVAATILPTGGAAEAFDALAAANGGVGLQLRKATTDEEAPAGPRPSVVPQARGHVETFAGGPEAGFADGRGAAARFAYPHGLALDDASHLYVADYNNHRIRAIAPDGTVTTIAGDGTPGFADGDAATARFRHPRGLAWHAGALYVVDSGNRAVRRLVKGAGGWTAETVAGGPEVPAEAGFVAPRDVAVDRRQDPPTLYVADAGGLRVRKIALGAPGRPLTTACELAGGSAGALQGPLAVAVDDAGTLLVADATSNAIRRFPEGGAPGTFSGGGVVGLQDGPALSARFSYPAALAFGQGHLVVADQLNHAVRRIDASGAVTTLAGSGTAGDADGVGLAAGFFRPSGVAVCPDGTIFVADADNHRIRRVRP